ncbi:MAG TPA: translation initiation factor [Ginsengibacter sp.]|nr:translation initiation factor [Chitinophagaceae bacterium]HRN71645.1 translation initiation factor [Ginsengibacter sp.]HRP18536.1 translation initiation factor [Ginsengibacter sp.]HRP45194.1 translation initiation factor [Ginsengibacter sp.]
MKKKNRNNASGIVYSTNPDFTPPGEDADDYTPQPIATQEIRIRLDKKQRAGKVVTLITGFDDTDEAIESIGKEIKKFCGTGGSAKEGEVLLQGDFREKSLQWLKKKGYTKSRII